MDKHIIQFAALGIAAVFVFLYYFVPWVAKVLGRHCRRQSAEAPKAPWYIRGIALLGILPTLYFFIVGMVTISSSQPFLGLGLLLVAILGAYTVWGLWWMRRVAAYLTLIFATMLLLGAIYLFFDASLLQEGVGFMFSCVATIVGMAAIIYCLVTHLSRMR